MIDAEIEGGGSGGSGGSNETGRKMVEYVIEVERILHSLEDLLSH